MAVSTRVASRWQQTIDKRDNLIVGCGFIAHLGSWSSLLSAPQRQMIDHCYLPGREHLRTEHTAAHRQHALACSMLVPHACLHTVHGGSRERCSQEEDHHCRQAYWAARAGLGCVRTIVATHRALLRAARISHVSQALPPCFPPFIYSVYLVHGCITDTYTAWHYSCSFLPFRCDAL